MSENPFGGDLPPGYSVTKLESAGSLVWMVWDEKNSLITSAQIDQFISASSHWSYIWRRWREAQLREPEFTPDICRCNIAGGNCRLHPEFLEGRDK